MNDQPLRVDREKKIIYGVKILGFHSTNGRYYEPEAVRDARPLYEGINVNTDHPEKPNQPRSVHDRFGWLENVKFRPGENGGLYGDLHYLVEDAFAKKLLAAAERRPQSFGLSHNAIGDGRTTPDGVYRCRKIVAVRSVDLVGDAGTTKSLTEGASMPLFDLTEAEKEEIASQMSQADDMPPEEAETTPEETPPGPDLQNEDESQEQVKTSILEILNGEEENSDKAARLTDLFFDLMSAMGEDGDETDPDGDGDDDSNPATDTDGDQGNPPSQDEETPPRKMSEGDRGRNQPKGRNLMESAAVKELAILKAANKRGMVLTEAETALCMAISGKDLIESQLELIQKANGKKSPTGKPKAGANLTEGKQQAPKAERQTDLLESLKDPMAFASFLRA